MRFHNAPFPSVLIVMDQASDNPFQSIERSV